MNIKYLGDPHLGKSFTNGVPLARRGERERMQWNDFTTSLMEVEGIDVHCCLGDLFDRTVVPYVVILQAALAYRVAAKTNPETFYIILRGNHDANRDLTLKSAYDVFAELLYDVENLRVLTGKPYQIGMVAFFPWQPVTTAEDFLRDYSPNIHVAVGHWDVSGDSDNLIPTKMMAELGIKKAVTGHVHLPHTFTRDGVDVTVVGSMQPYAHGEDPEEKLYITIPLESLPYCPRDLKNMCVRIDLEAGQKLEQEIDCLQLTVRRADAVEGDLTVTLGDFDMRSLFGEAFDEEQVPQHIRQQIIDRWSK